MQTHHQTQATPIPGTPAVLLLLTLYLPRDYLAMFGRVRIQQLLEERFPCRPERRCSVELGGRGLLLGSQHRPVLGDHRASFEVFFTSCSNLPVSLFCCRKCALPFSFVNVTSSFLVATVAHSPLSDATRPASAFGPHELLCVGLLLLPVGWPRHKGLRSAPWSLTRSRAAVSKTRGSSPSVVVQPLERKENHHDFMAQELVCCGHIQNLYGPGGPKPRTHQKQARKGGGARGVPDTPLVRITE